MARFLYIAAYDILTALAGMVWFILTHVELDFIVIASAFVLLGLYLIYHALDVGVWIFKKGQEKIGWKDCTACAGMGVLMISGALIPREHRSKYREGDVQYIQTNIANTKTCENCLGHGGYWEAVEDGTRNMMPTYWPGTRRHDL